METLQVSEIPMPRTASTNLNERAIALAPVQKRLQAGLWKVQLLQAQPPRMTLYETIFARTASKSKKELLNSSQDDSI